MGLRISKILSRILAPQRHGFGRGDVRYERLRIKVKTTLLLIDDYTLKHGWTYYRVCRLIDECRRRARSHGRLRILQLSHTHRSDEVIKHLDEPYSSMLAKGIAGTSNYATIFNGRRRRVVIKNR